MKIAVIDCGTNTFNLLIAEKNSAGKVHFILEDKIPVKIGKGGLEQGIIAPDAYIRALEAMKSYATIIQEHEVDQIIATSTSAFRSTSNGNQLQQEIKQTTGIDIEIITGEQE